MNEHIRPVTHDMGVRNYMACIIYDKAWSGGLHMTREESFAAKEFPNLESQSVKIWEVT